MLLALQSQIIWQSLLVLLPSKLLLHLQPAFRIALLFFGHLFLHFLLLTLVVELDVVPHLVLLQLNPIRIAEFPQFVLPVPLIVDVLHRILTLSGKFLVFLLFQYFFLLGFVFQLLLPLFL